jgi:hypothetical protein
LLRIHIRLTLRLALRATLGIPRSSVGSEAIGVGTDRLARTLAARRQRLSIRTQTRLLRRTLLGTSGPSRRRILLAMRTRTATTSTATSAARTTSALRTEVALAGTEARHEAALAGTAVLTERVLSLGTRTARTTRTATAARTTGTATAARTTGTATAARTTGTATTTRTATATRTATTAITELARRSRELPADARARHLAATRTIVVLLVFFGRADLEAAEAARLVAIAATTEATATATATTTLAAAATLVATTAVITALLLRTGDAIDHVVKLTARHRAMRTLLALEHAHEANLIDAIADDVERLEQTRRAVGLNTERRGDRVGRRILLGRLRLGRLALGRRLAAFGSGLATLDDSGLGAGISRLGAGCICGFDIARARRGSRRSGPGPTGSRTRSRSVTEQQRREFGQSLHRTG